MGLAWYANAYRPYASYRQREDNGQAEAVWMQLRLLLFGRRPRGVPEFVLLQV